MATSSPTSTNGVPTPHGGEVPHSGKSISPDIPESSHTSDADVTPTERGDSGTPTERGDSGTPTERGDSETVVEGSAEAETDESLELLDGKQLEERLGEARKAVIVGKYEDAIHLLPSCLASITRTDGELCLGLAEPHYLYGRSLFECARSGSGVFGEGMLKETSKEGEDGEEGDSNRGDEICAETTEEGNETEPSNFELAWENLEVSRVICSKHLEEKRDESIAKILLEDLTCLGELQVETGCYEKATDDYMHCLQLLDKFPEIRSKELLGATHYSIGISCSLAGDHQLAVKAFESALEALNDLLGEKEENSTEASSLKELVEEIKPRLAEAQEQMREKSERSHPVAKPLQSDEPTSSNGDEPCQVPTNSKGTISKDLGPVKVNDISHLVRKKRPADDSTAEPDESKRSKRDMSERDSTSGES